MSSIDDPTSSDSVSAFARRILFNAGSVAAKPLELIPLESESGMGELGWLSIENSNLDPLHAALLARWVLAELRVRHIAKRSGMSDEEIFVEHEAYSLQFLAELEKLIGTREEPAPIRPYAEVAQTITQLRDRYWLPDKFPKRRGRPTTSPPDAEVVKRIPSLIARLKLARAAIHEWYADESLERALTSILSPPRTDDIRQSQVRSKLAEHGLIEDTMSTAVIDFVRDRLIDEPTVGATRIAHRVAQDRGYQGEWRSFYDYWRSQLKAEP